uniref:Tyrosine-protein phosphatase domain-containing protein n=1 Tax=Caenorhabditis tropicalis TaxID=1561998 RepID=A0A1I7TBU4_9PELO
MLSDLETVYRNTTLKNSLIESNNLWTVLFQEIKERARYQTDVTPDEKLNFECVRVQPTVRSSSGFTDALLIEFPKIKQTYMFMQGIIPTNAAIHWQMILEQKPPVIIMLNDQKPVFGFPTDEPLTFTVYEITINSKQVHRSFVVKNMTVKNKQTGCSHNFEYYQFLFWHAYSTPPPQMLAEFHAHLLETKALQAGVGITPNSLLKATPPCFCPFIMSPPGYGRISVFILCDVFMRMLNDNIEDGFCIEQLMLKMSSQNPNVFQFFYEPKMVYTHVILLMEDKDPNLKVLGKNLRDYGKALNVIPTPRRIAQFMTPNKWLPWSWKLNSYLRQREEARKRQKERDERELRERLQAIIVTQPGEQDDDFEMVEL